MRALIIDEKIREIIKKHVSFAHDNPISTDDIKKTINGSKRPVGDNPNFVTHIFDGYRVVYSEEYQPVGLCRHISISISISNDSILGSRWYYPNPIACDEILKEFGFTNDAKSKKIWFEKQLGAVNFLEQIR